MIPAERQRTILSLLSHQEVISISELVEQLDVSHMTIRRDIVKLEASGKVVSVSGGVQLAQALHRELSHDAKVEQQANEKVQIGKLAAQLIEKDATVYLDAGTTSLEIAHQLATREDLLIITNDFSIAAYLMNHSPCEIYHTGGKVDRENQSSIGGKVAEFLAGMNIDIAFISSSSWSLKGLSTPNENKVLVKKAIVKSAQTNYLISDSTKYGRVASFHALDMESLDGVITDTNLPSSVIEELNDKGIEVINAPA
ncbi:MULTISPECIES: DeoR/GlpR family DNA-binding transcription regulator [Vibrio]|uniref:DeoR/GlpR transcriptional regulator n=1 Tax=Vibrio splendidus TaxID=29497 RepID=A0A2T5EML7_VIBSP|nr:MULTISPECIES: DeoR/GlpR family DNA-binding transcription regulator [Vibrio]EAP95423.1 glycerol-3-phosphate regulon repressor [Vibrio splendidus 12B01]MBB1464675.1 DeoR/GlpR transcriptional regulator [Vibrio sp. SG41-7]MCT4350479.1 DeoR/GlpR family DNA-binding transcription regulator [Vibrio sp. NC2]MDH5885682.1 DeoR/GlpR family DNA-binding transcription regulator [Vibrio splendidus]MDH5902339.1 DeoR/GlpR family DNA-binding transcription regulator [Vibrio splendidus]